MSVGSKADIVKYRRERAYEALNDAEMLMENNKLLLAINRVYYSGFYIVSALALLDDFATSKHKQMIGYFNNRYIRTGVINKEIGSIFNIAFRKRNSVDYADFVTIMKAEVQEYIERMKAFVKAVDQIITEKQF